MHILYERLTPAQDAQIKATVSDYTKAKADKNAKAAAGAVINFAAYLNENQLSTAVICITCEAAEVAIKYAAKHYEGIAQAEVTAAAKKRKQAGSTDAPAIDTNLA